MNFYHDLLNYIHWYHVTKLMVIAYGREQSNIEGRGNWQEDPLLSSWMVC